MAAENVGAVKIVGYLEKKGKLKVVTTWKKYWFVLEGRLLLYYRSQEEYENLSPCKGSINIGLATSIRPGLAAAGVFQIITRTSTVTLRAKERAIQEKWLQALLDATGQQTASNPIKMSHFRYSMDDLLPAGAKQSLTRQNTLPNRFQNRNSTILNRIRQIGVQTYGGSVDTINQLSKAKTQLKKVSRDEPSDAKMSAKSVAETNSDKDNEVVIKNDLYSGIIIENAQYVSADETKTDLDKNDVDHNKNCYIVENDQYVKSDAISLRNDTNSTNSDNSSMKPDDVEYYCTYGDVTRMRPPSLNIYQEPNLPPRPEERKSESDDCACGKEEGKVSRLLRFAMRFRSVKNEDNGMKKKSSSLIKKVMGKKKVSEQNNFEPIYDTVDYLEIEKSEMKKAASEELIKTLVNLQHKLEEKKSQIKEIIKSDASSPTFKEKNSMEEMSEDNTNIATGVNDTVADMINPPGLPPRRGSRSRSPFHDTPKNNALVKQSDLATVKLNKSTRLKTIDKILDDLEMESKKTDTKAGEELTVRQLIEKFNQSSNSSDESSLNNVSILSESTGDVSLRQKCEMGKMSDESEGVERYLANRHSDELNKLLEELTKVTSAPLLTPGVTSSLVQMKSEPLTDEEWLAITPIRRRRHSEPDYDVPRPHRSLQILPRSPDKEDTEESVIPATRFFGPVLPPTILTEQSNSWTSMSPDSLEPLQLYQAAMKQRRLDIVNSDTEKDRSVGYEKNTNHFELTVFSSAADVKIGNRYEMTTQDVVDSISAGSKSTDRFLDSLEPCGSAMF